MKIYQAIKYKKKLQSEIGELWSRFLLNNAVIKGNSRNYEPDAVLKEIEAKQDELIKLKVALQKANKPIYETIFKLAELKSYVNYVKGVQTHSGIVNERYNEVTVEYESKLSRAQIDEIVKKTQEEIGKLQEELDQFNFKTEVKIQEG